MKLMLKILLLSVILMLTACAQEGPQVIKFGKDQCDHCQMTITDEAYGAELITAKGRVYKFDDLSCMLAYNEENADKTQNSKLYISDFETKQLISIEAATFIKGGELKSPMGGDTAAFSDAKKAQEYASKIGAELVQGTPSIDENPHEEHNHDAHEEHSH